MIDLWKPPVVKIYDALDGQMRLVGGCVRDFLLDREPGDIDIATSLPPNEVIDRLKAQGIKAYALAQAHGVVAAVIGGELFEITTLRIDSYTETGREQITFITDYEEDAARRDFTINAMYMDRDNMIYDYFGGEMDLRERIIRFIGRPKTRIEEDPLRMFRYVRFWAVYGGEEPDYAVTALFPKLRRGLPDVSRERRRKEFMKILMGPRAVEAIELMAQTEILRYVLSGVNLPAYTKLIEVYPECGALERLSAVSNGQTLEHLNFTPSEQALMDHFADRICYHDTRRLKLIRGYYGERVFQYLLAKGVISGQLTPEQRTAYQTELTVPPMPVKESDLKGMAGMAKKRRLDEAMRILCRLWVDNDFPPDKETLLKLYADYINVIGRII